MKKFFKAKNLFLLMLTFMIAKINVLANDFDVIDEMYKLATSKEVQTGAWGLIKPGAVIVLLIIVAAGFALILLAIAYILTKAIAMYRGKGQIGKNEIKITLIGLIIGLAITGGGIFSVFKTANNVAVEPGVDLIEQQDNTTQNSN